jgi:hypothetical protein
LNIDVLLRRGGSAALARSTIACAPGLKLSFKTLECVSKMVWQMPVAFHQGLKPIVFTALCGTTEVVS